MSTPAQTVVFNFTSNGSATYSIPQEILAKDDIAVYFGASKQLDNTFSITTPTETGYSITFSPIPASGVQVMILRQVVTAPPSELQPNVPFTSNDLNIVNRRVYLQQVDADFYREKTTLQYDVYNLNPTGSIPQGDLVLPLLQTPAAGEAPRVWAKDSSGAIIDYPVDPGGKSAAQLETELSEATSTTSGAAKIGYWDGAAASTAKAALDKVSLPATSVTSNGAINISAWNLYQNADYSAGTPLNMQAMINLVSRTVESATASSSGAQHVPVWWKYRSGATDQTVETATTVASVVDEIFQYPDANTGSPVTWLIYSVLNMSGSGNQAISLQKVLSDLLDAGTAAGSTAYLWHKFNNNVAPGTEYRVRELLDASANAQSMRTGDYTCGWNFGSQGNNKLQRIYVDFNASIGKSGSGAKYTIADSKVFYNLALTYTANHNGTNITPAACEALFNQNVPLFLANPGGSLHLNESLTAGPIAMRVVQ